MTQIAAALTYFSKRYLFCVCSLVAIFSVIIYTIEPVPQLQNYHNLADHSKILGISGAGDILSNLPYAAVAMIALFWIVSNWNHFRDVHLAFIYILFFFASGSVSITSTLYHINPNNLSILPDRISIILSGTLFLSIASHSRVSNFQLVSTSFLLATYGFWSLYFWHSTSNQPHENISYYAFFQVLLILLAAIFCVQRAISGSEWRYIGLAIFAFVISRPFELWDEWVHNLTGEIISGHTLKHLIIVVSVYSVYRHMIVTAKH